MTSFSASSATPVALAAALVLSAALATPAAAVAQETAATVVSFAAADTVAPSDVTGVNARATSASTVEVSWTAATDDRGVVRYEVRSPVTTIVATVDAGTTTTTLTGLAPGSWYSVQVWAYDAAGNVSASNVADLRLPSADAELMLPDVEAPSAVKTLSALKSRVTSTTAHLVWSRAVDNVGVAEYRVRDRLSGAVVATVPGAVGITGIKGHTVTLSPATTYELEVVAVDAAGNASLASKSVTVTTKPAA